MQADKILEGLNDRQKEAVTYNDGPLLVIAGAGTGKTAVITKKIAYLIMNKMAKPEEILALTFTKKAANEMTERVDILLPYGYSDVNVKTFHSFAEEFLRENAYYLGFSTNFKILTEPQQILFVKDHIFDFNLKIFRPLSDPTYFIRDLLKVFSRAKDELVTSDDYLKFSDKLDKKADSSVEKEWAEEHVEIAHAYKTYQELLINADRMDFGDLVMQTIEALKKNDRLLDYYRKKYKYILVDEFQDTNWVQNELLKVLTIPRVETRRAVSLRNAPIITVVGDDDQSIYKFRGAAVSNILDFKDSWENVKQIVLNQNYRNTQEILDSSYEVIRNNNPDRLEAKYGIDKKLISNVEARRAVPLLLYFDSESEEAEKIAEKIREIKESARSSPRLKRGFEGQGLYNKEEVSWSNFAILVRSNNQAMPFINALISKKIPFTFSGSEGLFRKKIIKDLISFLSILTNPNDNLALFNLLVSDIFKVDFDQLSIILHKVRSVNIPLEQYLRSFITLATKDKENLDEKNIKKIKNALDVLEKLRRESINKGTGEILYEFLQQSGYLKKLSGEEKKGSVEDGEKIISIASFFDHITSFQESNLDLGVQKFIEYLNVLLEIGDDGGGEEFEDPNFDAVRVLTIHKAKGLEFEYVFMVGMVDSRFPGRKYSDAIMFPDELLREKLPEGDSHIQEERRLFYVGMTRAKKNLYFSAGKDYGGKRTTKISRFVVEAVGEKNIKNGMIKLSPIERIRKFEAKEKVLYSSRLKIKEGKMRLSRAEVDDYLTCPRKYKFVHITPIRLLADPRVMFGRAVHRVIEEYYKVKLQIPNSKLQTNYKLQIQNNPKDLKDLKDLNNPNSLTLDQLLEIYKQNWSSEGFLSQEHETARYNEGIEIIKKFYNEYSKIFKVSEIEKKFKFEVDNNIVEGRIDVIEDLDDKNIRIIDFKTSDIENEEKANRRAVESIQLAVYALAIEQIEGKIPEEVGLFFLGSGILGIAKPNEKILEKTKESIIKASEGIRSQDFQATPDKIKCGQCPYSRYCDDSVV